MFEIDIPIRTYSEQNQKGHWSKAYMRHKKQKEAVHFFLKKQDLPSLPVIVTLCRISFYSLDAHDNLPYSMKWIADAVAERLTGKKRGADDTKQIVWRYEQIKCDKKKDYGIRIKIEAL